MKPANISNQRILTEVKKLSAQNLDYLKAGPLPDDLYTWHFTFRGPQHTDFHEGLYHGQIILPYEYPFKPPDIVFMNKNGRFETNTKICLTITQYHPEEWNSAWTIRTMLEAVISLFAQNVQGVGSLSASSDIRTFLAKNSHSFVCDKCGPIKDILAPRGPLEHKPKQSVPKEQEVEQQLPRKQSEAIPQVQTPKLNNLFSQKIVQERKEKMLPPDRGLSDTWKQQRPSIQRPAYSKPLQQEPAEEYYGNQVIYLTTRDEDAERQLGYKKNIQQIKQNLKLLQGVISSVKWI